jgi:BirA family biotin operon repressor/biotin-[acetyl-CoA-carboxylase] ligase
VSDTQRAPLQAAAIRASVQAGSRLWSQVSVVAETGSTNEDLIAAAGAGAADGTVLVAERQTKGRGRLGRSWLSEPGAALTFSVLLRPLAVPPAGRGWLPLLAGVAVAAGVRAQTGLDVSLKWPNDVVAVSAGPAGSLGKLAGILAEQAGDAIVIGAGLNVAATPVLAAAGRPSAGYGPASLADLGATATDRTALLTAILRDLEHWYLRWVGATAPGDAVSSGLRAEYLRSCCTVGRDVRVELPGGTTLTGRACDIDGTGRLLVATEAGVQTVSAGDVIHVR